MLPELVHQSRSENRSLTVALVTGWVMGFAFMLAAFTEFPEHKWSIGLGYLAFLTMLRACLQQGIAMHAANNMLSDAAERKTRHTMLLASEWSKSGRLQDEFDHGDFWQAVDRRVKTETGEPDAHSFWLSLALTAGGIILNLLGSLIGFGIAAALTS